MNTLLLAVIIIVVVALILALTKGQGATRKFPYQQSKYLLSKPERSFYGVLVQAVEGSGLIFSKVRVADVVTPKKGLNRSDWQRAFNAISSKHLDFVICDPGDCSIKLAIELDDSSHGSAKVQKRDNLLNAACESAGLPLLRVKASRSYAITDIRRLVQEAILPPPKPGAGSVASENRGSVILPDKDPRPQMDTQSDSFVEKNTVASVTVELVAASPACPKWGQRMLLRKAKTGANAGQEFWGCSAFPKCRAVVKVSA